MKEKVWFISGCSTGFGRELSIYALEQGYRVAVASRNTDDVEDISSKYKERTLSVKLDMTKPEELKAAIEKIKTNFERIDILVNNVGIGYFAGIEESEEIEVEKCLRLIFLG